jgi:hypothetical protein
MKLSALSRGRTLSAVPSAVLAALLVILLPGRPARAEADAATAVLGFEALDGAPDNVASEITDALRQRVAGSHGFQLVQGKDLVEVKLVFSCPDEGPACMAQAGKSMGATKLIYGNVKRAGADYQIALKLLDVNKASVEAWATEAIPRRKAEPTVFRSLAPSWLSKLTGKGAGGSLQIRANVSGATVSLDGTQVGVTGTQPVAVADVGPGRHEVTVEKTGYTTAKQEFSLAAGQSLPLSLALSSVSVDVGSTPPAETPPPIVVRKPPEAPSPPEGGGSTMARAGFWVAVVGTVGLVAGGAYFAKQVHDVNSQLDPFRHVGCQGTPAGPNQPQCFASSGLPYTTTPDMTNKINDLVNKGNNYQKYEVVMFGIAVPVAIAGGYFLYKGYLSSSSDSGKEASATTSSGLRIFPTASASGGGIVTEFDF